MKGSYGASLVVRAIATWAIFQGLMLIIGGEARWTSPVYDVADLMPGAPLTWGIIVLVGGIIILCGSLTDRHLPFKHFNIKWPSLRYNVNGKVEPYLKSIEVDWSSEQFRNMGLGLVAAWLFLFGISFAVTVFLIPDIGLATWTRDILLSIICLIMIRVREPKHDHS